MPRSAATSERTGLDQVQSVNATTGAVTNLTLGAQPWGTNVNCGAMDPATGDIFVGTSSDDVWRLASGSGASTLYASGLGQPEEILLLDTATPRYLHCASTSRFGRVAFDVAGTSGTYFGALRQPALSGVTAAAVDEHGDFLVRTTAGDGAEFGIPREDQLPLAGIAPGSLGSFVFSGPSVNQAYNISVVGATLKPSRLTVESVPVLGAKARFENVPQPLGKGWLLFSSGDAAPARLGPRPRPVPRRADAADLEHPADARRTAVVLRAGPDRLRHPAVRDAQLLRPDLGRRRLRSDRSVPRSFEHGARHLAVMRSASP